ncbi:MAG: methionyl-tRNA formyltransferase [Oscillospiraceae bacterium]
MRIVFMGTPEIAQVALTVLLAEGHEVVGVYTRADKPVGRKQRVTPSPVKLRAAENGIPVFQPGTLRTPEAAAQLAALAPELVAVVAYGLLLPADVLAVPQYGCINLHVSRLPQYRGAAPIQWALINGDAETGVSVMQMDEGLDTGPVLASQTLGIPPAATAGEMFELVTGPGARLLAQTVADIAAGKAKPQPQQGLPSYAPQLKKSMAEVDFEKPSLALHNLVRGCNPWPMAWFTAGGRRVQVHRARPADAEGRSAREVLSASPLTIACGEGALVLEKVQPDGARVMDGTEWARGRRLKAGDIL